jgi:hypothetical protein
MNQINAMRQALEALENLQGLCSEESDFVEQVTIWTPEAIDDLRQAIEQAGKAEPVLVVARHDLEKLLKHPEGDKHIKAFIPPGMGDEVLLYTHPPTAPAQPYSGCSTAQVDPFVQAPAQQPLTDAAIQATWTRTATYDTHLIDVLNFARAIEASHGIKGASL